VAHSLTLGDTTTTEGAPLLRDGYPEKIKRLGPPANCA
jgi:hypothetical protein